jgi:hypothetical protein
MKITAEVRPLCSVTEEEAKTFIAWMWECRKRANFDMAVMSYPRTVMFSAADEQGTTVFLPAQPILMFESLCPRPNASKHEVSYSLWKIGELADSVMRDVGMHESYFLTNDSAEADSTGKHGWIKLLHDAEKNTWLMKRRIPEVQQDAT